MSCHHINHVAVACTPRQSEHRPAECVHWHTVSVHRLPKVRLDSWLFRKLIIFFCIPCHMFRKLTCHVPVTDMWL